MDEPLMYDAPFVNSVFHPSDFTKASENAFAHALAIALRRKTKFTILHAGEGKEDWRDFPAVRYTLEKWGMLEKGSPKSAVFEELALRVKKVSVRSSKPLAAVVEYLEKHPTDLIVLATEGRDGLPRWIRPSVAERIAEKTRTKTLFVPKGVPGFVSVKDGTFSIRRILVPVDHAPSPLPAVEYAARLARASGEPMEVFLLHVSKNSGMPAFALPEVPNCAWTRLELSGEVVDVITGTARERSVDLIMMTTAGSQGFLDAVRGSVTDQVLRGAPCPLLVVPMG